MYINIEGIRKYIVLLLPPYLCSKCKLILKINSFDKSTENVDCDLWNYPKKYIKNILKNNVAKLIVEKDTK